MKRTTDGVAIGGLTLPTWQDALQTSSGVAVSLVPILSAVWLTVQIARFILDWKRSRHASEE